MSTSVHLSDNTRDWIEQHGRIDGKLKPSLLVRTATDTNYLRVAKRNLSGLENAYTKSIMNLALPGQRVPGILSWSVTESAEQVTQTAQLEMLNCLPVSEIQTTMASGLEGLIHSSTIVRQYARDSKGTPRLVQTSSNTPGTSGDLTNYDDSYGYMYDNGDLLYRRFADQTFSVNDASAFPNPAIPDDVDNDVSSLFDYSNSVNGIGAYYVQIGAEIVRVIRLDGNTFTIPPGGRAIAGTPYYNHTPGEVVKLLGFGPYTSEWTGMGYLNIDDYNPQMALLRPGTALVSYEGWGNIGGLMTHKVDHTRNYVFTGYWFVTSCEPNIAEDGVPKISIGLKSAGTMLEQQKISMDLLQRAKTRFGQWRVGQQEQTIWGAADHDREIPGDWVDYDAWDPSLSGSYPMKIQVEFAQHKAFFDHMQETNKGKSCEICQDEATEWRKTHKYVKGTISDLKLQRAVGRHIYKESIRVLQEEAGPIKTYIRLIATLAMAAWDHPAYGTEAAQHFSKIPNQLYDNLRNIFTGLVFNGQVDFDLARNDPYKDWFPPNYDDDKIISRRRALTCPFEATYDKSSFAQPALDLADVNGCRFWISREGYPVFKPRLFNFRPSGSGVRNLAPNSKPGAQPYEKETGEWFMAYGASISGYSHSIETDAIITQAWIQATTCFETQLTVVAGGTGITGSGQRVKYSGIGGNSDGLGITSGVQQTDTVTLDSLVLGLDWNTNAAAWGTVQEHDNGGREVINAKPTLYQGSPTLRRGSRGSGVQRIQRTLRFFVDRQYIQGVVKGGASAGWDGGIDGVFDADTEGTLKNLQNFLGINDDGVYSRGDYHAINDWLNENKHYVMNDIWWYAITDKPWTYYLSAITGVPVRLQAPTKDTKGDVPDPIDDKETQRIVGEWTQGFSKDLLNAANRTVDSSLDQATVRSIQSNMADPRVIPGDVIWAEIPGFLGSRGTPPYTNGIYVLQIQRNMDLAAGSYTATYSGHRFLGDFNGGLPSDAVSAGYGFVRG